MLKRLLIASTFLLFSTALYANPNGLASIQQTWDEITYTVPKEAQFRQFLTLIDTASQYAEDANHSPESLIWLAGSQSGAARAKGGLDALDLAKQAKENLERAIAADKTALEGAGLGILASLYHKVPGWPVGFGSDKKARKLFKEALEVNPNGLDSNYFYAEFLFDEKDYDEAAQYLEKAKQAPGKQGRPLATKARQQDIVELEAKLKEKR